MLKRIVAGITLIALTLCIAVGCGSGKTGENVMPEEDFNIYSNGEKVMSYEDIGMNTFLSLAYSGGESHTTYRGVRVGDKIELLKGQYGGEIVCYEENGELKECTVNEYIEDSEKHSFNEGSRLNVSLYRINYDDKIYSKKEISELPVDDGKLFTYACLTFYLDLENQIIDDIGFSHGRKALGFQLA